MAKRIVTPEMVDRMRELQEEGMEKYKIAHELGIGLSSVNYHLDPSWKEKCRISSRGWHKERNKKIKLAVIALLGGKCVNCGNDDPRVLQINHINGGGKSERELGSPLHNFYRAILDGTRPTDDLDLRCANCNILYEYEVGRRYNG